MTKMIKPLDLVNTVAESTLLSQSDNDGHKKMTVEVNVIENSIRYVISKDGSEISRELQLPDALEVYNKL